jgi:ABC-type nitrate/sulfonate/bicarbonate transport system ATPase subunit
VDHERQRCTEALAGVNLEVGEGEFTAIIGPSGCGKTTFLNAADGLIEIDRGRIEIDGTPVRGPGPDRAMVCDLALLLLDEPFASLDAQTRELMQAELLRLWGETRKTSLFITHQIDEACYLADRVVVFSRRPAVVKEGPPALDQQPIRGRRPAHLTAVRETQGRA